MFRFSAFNDAARDEYEDSHMEQSGTPLSPASKTIRVPPRKNAPPAVINPAVELPFLTEEVTKTRMEFWRGRAKSGCYDTDTHIVDPIAHYAHLEYLQRHVVANSKFLRCFGKYDVDDHAVPVYWMIPLLHTQLGNHDETRHFVKSQ
jgi:hypothetical protein